MLLNDFFFIEDISRSEGNLSASLRLNISHPVYEGHFPGMPVVPGVCMIEMVKEVLCAGNNELFLLSQSKMCKFINMMNPTEVDQLKCIVTHHETEEGEHSFTGELTDINRTYLKIKGTLTKGNGQPTNI